jgi:hypothetical protein
LPTMSRIMMKRTMVSKSAFSLSMFPLPSYAWPPGRLQPAFCRLTPNSQLQVFHYQYSPKRRHRQPKQQHLEPHSSSFKVLRPPLYGPFAFIAPVEDAPAPSPHPLRLRTPSSGRLPLPNLEGHLPDPGQDALKHLLPREGPG